MFLEDIFASRALRIMRFGYILSLFCSVAVELVNLWKMFWVSFRKPLKIVSWSSGPFLLTEPVEPLHFHTSLQLCPNYNYGTAIRALLSSSRSGTTLFGSWGSSSIWKIHLDLQNSPTAWCIHLHASQWGGVPFTTWCKDGYIRFIFRRVWAFLLRWFPLEPIPFLNPECCWTFILDIVLQMYKCQTWMRYLQASCWDSLPEILADFFWFFNDVAQWTPGFSWRSH